MFFLHQTLRLYKNVSRIHKSFFYFEWLECLLAHKKVSTPPTWAELRQTVRDVRSQVIHQYLHDCHLHDCNEGVKPGTANTFLPHIQTNRRQEPALLPQWARWPIIPPSTTLYQSHQSLSLFLRNHFCPSLFILCSLVLKFLDSSVNTPFLIDPTRVNTLFVIHPSSLLALPLPFLFIFQSLSTATKRDTSLLYVDLPPSPGQTANPQWCPLIEAGFQVRPGEVTKARTMG